MVSLGRAVLRLEADASRFNAGMDAAERRARASSRAIAYAMLGIGSAITGALALTAREAIRFESSFAGIRKTVEATEQQFERLSRQMRDMALRIPINVNEINKIAEIGGQLGVQADNLATFTETIARLGVATNITATQAAQDLAQFINVMGVGTDRAGEFAAVLVELGNNTATTESAILNISKRIAAFGVQVGLSHDEVQALGATLLESGVRPEAGGTAIGRTLTMIAKAVDEGTENLQKFAEISRMSADDFARLWGENAQEALLAFLQGIRAMREEGGDSLTTLNTANRDLISSMEDLQISSVRQRQSIFAVTNNLDGYIENLRIAKEQTILQNALLIESNKRFGTSESQLKLLQNSFREVAIVLGEAFLPAVVEIAKTFAGALRGVGEFLKEHKTLAKIIVTTMGVGGTMLLAMGAFKLATLALVPAFTTAKVAGIAMIRGWGAALALNPIGAILTFIAGAVALVAFNWDTLKKAFDDSPLEKLQTDLQEVQETGLDLPETITAITDSIAELESAADDATGGVSDLRQELAELNRSRRDALESQLKASGFGDPIVQAVLGEVFPESRTAGFGAEGVSRADIRKGVMADFQALQDTYMKTRTYTVGGRPGVTPREVTEEYLDPQYWIDQEAAIKAALEAYDAQWQEIMNLRVGEDARHHPMAGGQVHKRDPYRGWRDVYPAGAGGFDPYFMGPDVGTRPRSFAPDPAAVETWIRQGERILEIQRAMARWNEVDAANRLGSAFAGRSPEQGWNLLGGGLFGGGIEGAMDAEGVEAALVQIDAFTAQMDELSGVTLDDMNAALGTNADSWKSLWLQVDDKGLLERTAKDLQSVSDKLETQQQQIERAAFRYSDFYEAMSDAGGAGQIIENMAEELGFSYQELSNILLDAYGNTNFLTNEFDLQQAAIAAGLGPELTKLIGIYQRLKKAEDALRQHPGIEIDRKSQWDLAWAAGHGKIDPLSYQLGEKDGKLFVQSGVEGETREELGERLLAQGFIKSFHNGGIVPGNWRENVPIMAQAGEMVIPAEQAGASGTTIVHKWEGANIYGWDEFADAVAEAQQDLAFRGNTQRLR